MSCSRAASISMAAWVSLTMGAHVWGESHQPTHYVLFLDCSPSARADQQQRWQQEGRKQIAALSPGDALQIFLLHDNTATAAEAFAGAAPAGDTLSAKRMVADLRRRSAEALACPSNQSRGRDTDILGAIDRLRPNRGRRTIVVFFSDMLNSTPEADIERRPLRPERMPEIITAAPEARMDSRDACGRHRALCIEQPRAGPESQSPNDRRTIEAFYRLLFESLGGHLAQFSIRRFRRSCRLQGKEAERPGVRYNPQGWVSVRYAIAVVAACALTVARGPTRRADRLPRAAPRPDRTRR